MLNASEQSTPSGQFTTYGKGEPGVSEYGNISSLGQFMLAPQPTQSLIGIPF